MRLAIVNNERSAPSPGLAGFCPACGKPLIPRCGSQRVHHWAHRSERACDHWWEPETGWHRSWKLQFPEDWQEIVLHAATGERHIADVRTAQGLTIEFQHSHLKPEERTAREDFYGEMVWVVDGLRLRRDLPRFREGARDLRNLKAGRVYLHRFPDQLFPSSWTKRNAPVFIDFSGGAAPVQSLAPVERSLWCLLPQRDATWGVVLRFSRDEFVLAARKTRPCSWAALYCRT